MSTLGNPAPNPPPSPPALPVARQPGAPGPPKVDMMASGEMQAWLSRLKVEDHKIGKRNKYLAGILAAGVLLLVVILWVVYDKTIGAYAVIDPESIRVEQHPIEQGRLRIRFNVISPGKVCCRRTSGDIATERIDYFDEACEVDRNWSWGYQPGENIDLVLRYRGGLFRKTFSATAATFDRADIVILMDTTESMDPYIVELKEKCAVFSEKLDKMALEHRFALIGFGDTSEADPWLQEHGFAPDVGQFITWTDQVERFNGGDLPESALDALEKALELPLEEKALRRFYLVTDAAYHEPTGSGATAEDLRKRLREHRVLLRVFSHRKFKPDYEKLLGETGRFQEIENFGKVLSEGRVLED